jgi:hypothetical protein
MEDPRKKNGREEQEIIKGMKMRRRRKKRGHLLPRNGAERRRARR